MTDAQPKINVEDIENAPGEQPELDLNDDTPLTPVCDLSGEGTCEACQ